MNKVMGKRRAVCLVLSATIFLTLLFIFGNSLASREDSKAVSDKVNESVGEIIETVTGKEESSLEDLFTKYHRKIAHFFEFAVLGVQILLLLHFSDRRNFSYLLSGALFSFAVASIDEGIQMLTGRGDQVSDVFIDVCGYLCTYLIGILVFHFLFWRCRREKTSVIPQEKEKECVRI